MESHSTTALAPSLNQFARISEPRMASDQTRGVCLLVATLLHPLELVFGLHLWAFGIVLCSRAAASDQRMFRVSSTASHRPQ